MKKNFLFTSESVSEGHPDKVCDRISDMVVDSFLASEPQARVACETLTTTNKVVLAGEVRGPELKEDELISKVRDCIKDIGYDQDGFSWKEQTKIERDGSIVNTGNFSGWTDVMPGNWEQVNLHDESLKYVCR